MLLQEPVQAAVWQCLNRYAYADAAFLAELLHAERPGEESAYLLATCYYRAARVDEAFWLLSAEEPPRRPDARYLLAKCALDLGKLSEAEAALAGAETDFGDAAPFALKLLAQVYGRTERRDRAADAHLRALDLNPLLWDSFAKLCDDGRRVDAAVVFSSAPRADAAPEATPDATNLAVREPPRELAVTPDAIAPAGRLRSVFGAAPSPLSPSFGVAPLDESPAALTDANEQKSSPKLMHSLRAQVDHLKEAFAPAPRQQRRPERAQPPHVRRSSRLFGNGYSVKENNKSPNRKFPAPKSPSRKSKQRCSGRRGREAPERASPAPAARPAASSGDGLMELLRSIGEAYSRLAAMDCRTALELFERLPPKHYRSPWVRTLVATAHHELGEYEAAAAHFGAVRASHPARTEGLDLYSTCLWHLQREVELSALAREAVSRSRRCPAAWIAAGNCFSLHKEHDAAARFFRRAVQLRPDAPYAHTLLGHEYAATEETDKALACFRRAVRLDPRHYKAWFGLATVFSKQERFEDAEAHFRRALAVHPESGALRCHLGVALVALGRPEKALRTLDRAVAADPRNPLCRFHKASLLSSTGRLREALRELDELQELVPKESLVYYLLGKVHNKLGNSDLALMHFSRATDLDPKGTGGHIKEAFDPARPDDAPDDAPSV